MSARRLARDPAAFPATAAMVMRPLAVVVALALAVPAAASCTSAAAEATVLSAGDLPASVGTDEYPPLAACAWHVPPTTAPAVLQFTSLDVEDGFDHIHVYRGNTTDHRAIAELTGTFPAALLPSFVSLSGLLIVLTSDATTEFSGFSAAVYYAADPPPALPLPAQFCAPTAALWVPAPREFWADSVEIGLVPLPSNLHDFPQACPQIVKSFSEFDTYSYSLWSVDFSLLALEKNADFVDITASITSPTPIVSLTGEPQFPLPPFYYSGHLLSISARSDASVTSEGFVASVFQSDPAEISGCSPGSVTHITDLEVFEIFIDSTSTSEPCYFMVSLTGEPRVAVTFESLTLRSAFVSTADHITVYDSSFAASDRVVARYQGLTVPDTPSLPSVASERSERLLLAYQTESFSDAIMHMRMRIHSLSAFSGCPSECLGRGVCAADGTCHCFAGWTGSDCDEVVCGLAPSSSHLEDGDSVAIALDAYVPLVRCEWTITTNASLSLLLLVSDESFEKNGDLLLIESGDTTVAHRPGLPITLSPAGLRILFQSDHSVQTGGFALTVSAVALSSDSDEIETWCSGGVAVDLDESLPQSVHGTNPPSRFYYPDSDCRWLATVPDGFTAVFRALHFDTEPGWDFLSIYDGPSVSSSPLVGKYSGQTLPPSFTSSTTQLLVQFTSDYAVQHSGVRFELSIGINSANCPSGCSGHGACVPSELTGDNGFACVCEDGYAGTGCEYEACRGLVEITAVGAEIVSQSVLSPQYAPSASCSWLVSLPDSAGTAAINFVAVETEKASDVITVYDGPSASDPLLAVVSGSLDPAGLQVNASTGQALVTFHSDQTVQMAGFRAVVGALLCSGPCVFGTCAAGVCQCEDGYYGPACETSSCPSPDLFAFYGALASHVGPDGTRGDLFCGWTIRSPERSAIRIDVMDVPKGGADFDGLDSLSVEESSSRFELTGHPAGFVYVPSLSDSSPDVDWYSGRSRPDSAGFQLSWMPMGDVDGLVWDECIANSLRTMRDKSGVLLFDGIDYDESAVYVAAQRYHQCRWAVDPELGTNVTLVVDRLHLAGETTMRILEPASIAATLTQTFGDGIGLPSRFIKVGPSFIVEIETRGRDPGPPPKLRYTILEEEPPCGECDGGHCVGGTCVCDYGRFGDACQYRECHGTTTLTGGSGTLSNFDGDVPDDALYAHNMRCIFSLQPAAVSEYDLIRLTIDALDTEKRFDTLRLFAGCAAAGTPQHEMSGALPDGVPLEIDISFPMTVEFVSDASGPRGRGFHLSYQAIRLDSLDGDTGSDLATWHRTTWTGCFQPAVEVPFHLIYNSQPPLLRPYLFAAINLTTWIYAGSMYERPRFFDVQRSSWSSDEPTFFSSPGDTGIRVSYMLTNIGTTMWMSGGQEDREFTPVGYFDMWRLAVDDPEWVRVDAASQNMKPRVGAGIAAVQDRWIVIFGGQVYEDIWVRSGDLFIFDTAEGLDVVFDQVIPIGDWPSERTNPAMATSGLSVYMHGGYAHSRGVGKSRNDLWRFDFDSRRWSFISETGPTLHAHSAGFIDSTIFISGGFSDRFRRLGPDVGSVWTWDSTELEWRPVARPLLSVDPEVQSAPGTRSMAFASANRVVLGFVAPRTGLAGKMEAWSTAIDSEACSALGVSDRQDCVDCDTGKVPVLTSAGVLCLACPEGYERSLEQTECTPCPPGSYADSIGTTLCWQCPEGTYSQTEAATSASTCEPCPTGTFGPNPGNSACQSCDVEGALCALGAVTQLTIGPLVAAPDDSADQPDEGFFSVTTVTGRDVERVESAGRTVWLSIGTASAVVFIGVAILYLFFRRSAMWILVAQSLRRIDFAFVTRHHSRVPGPMFKRRTTLGGLFTASYLAVMAGLGAYLLLEALNVEAITESLIPLESSDRGEFLLTAQVELLGYTGECVCAPGYLEWQLDASLGADFRAECTASAGACTVSIESVDDVLAVESTLTLVAQSPLAGAVYAQAVIVTLEAPSFDDGTSRLSTSVQAVPGAVLAGPVPSEVEVSVIPSVFKRNANEHRGFALTLLGSTVGSLLGADEFGDATGLSVVMNLKLSQFTYIVEADQARRSEEVFADLLAYSAGLVIVLSLVMNAVEIWERRRRNNKLGAERPLESLEGPVANLPEDPAEAAEAEDNDVAAIRKAIDEMQDRLVQLEHRRASTRVVGT